MFGRLPRIGLVMVLALSATLVACYAALAAKPQPNPAVVISTAKVGKLGTVLVNSSGHVLYMFAPDKHTKVACDSACQEIWPPVTAPKAGVAKAVGSAKQSLVGSYKNPVTGHRIVTYNGWPLYTYITDHAPAQADGENIDLSGGYWWVLTVNGHVEK
jgi:predicted lipoprotein with Yx(FWY)xxD motif